MSQSNLSDDDPAMRIYPSRAENPAGIDERVVKILLQYLPEEDALEDAYNLYFKRCGSKCKQADRRCPEAHTIEIGFGFRGEPKSFGQLFFVCSGNGGRQLMTNIGLEDIDLGTALQKIKHLQPPAIPTHDMLRSINEFWYKLLPAGYKYLTPKTVERILDYDDKRGIKPFPFCNFLDVATKRLSKSNPDPNPVSDPEPFPFSPSKANHYYESKNGKKKPSAKPKKEPTLFLPKRKETASIKQPKSKLPSRYKSYSEAAADPISSSSSAASSASYASARKIANKPSLKRSPSVISLSSDEGTESPSARAAARKAARTVVGKTTASKETPTKSGGKRVRVEEDDDECGTSAKKFKTE